MQIITTTDQKEIKKHGNDSFPLLVSRERLSAYESGSFLWHWHPEIELTLVLEGEMLYHVNRSDFHLCNNDILFCNASALHSGSARSGKDCRYLSVTFHPQMIYGFHQSAVCRKYVEPVIQDMGFSAILFHPDHIFYKSVHCTLLTLVQLYNDQPDFYEIDMIRCLLEIWEKIFLSYHPTLPLSESARKEQERIRQILSYLDNNYMYSITLKNISDVIHLCPGECSRLFKKHMKVPLFSYLKEYRIERSLNLLANPELSITEIAALCGFHDPNYYTKVFRTLKGCAPGTYRKTAETTEN